MSNWCDGLPKYVYARLRCGKTRKSDLPILVDAKWQSNKNTPGYAKEDALKSVLELLDHNGGFIELTNEEYDALCR